MWVLESNHEDWNRTHRENTMKLACTMALAVLITGVSFSADAAGTPEQRRACRADAMKFCREFVPNVRKVTSCMERNMRRLSPACQAQFK